MDDVDRQIVALLVEDARRSWSDVGARVNLSAPAVARRVERLVRDGVVTGWTARLGPAGRTWSTEAFVEMFCGSRTSIRDIKATVAGHPEVLACYTVTGDADAIVHLRAESVGHLEETIEQLRLAAPVARSRTTIVLTRLVDQRGT